MIIRKTVSITFPRSGHHLLVDMLRAYCGSSLFYCEIYKRGHLQERAEVNYLKTHDFDLHFETPEGWMEIVQIRDPVEAIESWHNLDLGRNASLNRHDFWGEKLKFYADFMGKWAKPNPRRIFVHYRQLIDEPIQTLWRVLRHISEDHIDLDRLYDVVESIKIRPYRGVRPCFLWGQERLSKPTAYITNQTILP